MNRFLALYFLLIFNCFSFLSSGEKKSVMPTQSKVVTPYQWIQTALVDIEELIERKEYNKLKPLYLKILALDPKVHLPSDQYHDFLISYAYSEAYLNRFEGALEALQQLDLETMTPSQIFRKEMLISKLYYSKGEFKDALIHLNLIFSMVQVEHWGMQDRAFYIKVQRQVSHYYEVLLTQAEDAFEARLYQEALSPYAEIVEGMKNELYQVEDSEAYAQICLRLAASYYFSKDFKQARDLFIEVYDQGLIDLNSQYLLVLSCGELGQYELAFKYCKEYLNSGPHHSQEQLEAAQFELARLYYELKDYDKAQELLLQYSLNLKSPYYQSLSRFYMAKIFLKSEDYEKMETWLSPQYFDFLSYPTLRPEWSYLRAEAFFQRKEYALAIKGFEEALAQTQEDSDSWSQEALYNLAWSYLKLGEDPLSQIQAKQSNLQIAEQKFQNLLKSNSSDRVSLGLARVYLMQSKLFGGEQAAKQLNKLIQNYPLKESSSQLKIGLTLAEVQPSLKEKEKTYANLSELNSLPPYERALLNFFRGRNLFNLALQTQNIALYSEVILILNETWSSLYSKEPQYLETALKLTTLSSIHLGDFNSLVEGYDLLDHFLSFYPNYSAVREELFYYKALVASKLMLFEQGDAYYKKGVEAAEALLAAGENGPFCDQTLYLLGTLFFQNKDYAKARHSFLKLIEIHPCSKWLGDAWFWAAECNDLEAHDPNISREYRKRVYENYPESSHAAEAYFYTYSFTDYLEGNKEALDHLTKMENLFPNSSFVVVSYYLQALGWKEDHFEVNGALETEKDLSKSDHFFNLAIENFRSHYQKNNIPKENLKYLVQVYYRSYLGKAQAYLQNADQDSGAKRQLYIERAIDAYNELIADFKKAEHPLTVFFQKEALYPELLEEAEFGLAKACIKNFQLQKGEQKLNEMLEQYNKAEIKKSYYCSRAWYELGLISMAKESYLDALEFFHQSELSADDRITSDQIIDLGIQQSLCYRFSGQLDLAMLTLSKIINEGLVSNLRVKAMYLRAEIYEIQGRNELAQRQLEAASKKGGEWARMSQDRLIAEYEFN